MPNLSKPNPVTRFEKTVVKAGKLTLEERVLLVDTLDPEYAEFRTAAVEREERAADIAKAKASVVDYTNDETWTNSKGETRILDDLSEAHLTNIYKQLKTRASDIDARAEYVGYATARLARAGVFTFDLLDIVRAQLAIDSAEKFERTPLAKAILNLI